MKPTLRLLLCLAVAGIACGGASADAIDARLAQKVTYEARYQTVQRILEDLSAETGIKLKAGASNFDWAVRSRRMNIFVRDVTVASLMNSIAHVMKFRWSPSEKEDPPYYRLVVDRKAVTAADEQKKLGDKKKEEIWQKRRQEWVDVIMKCGSMSPEEVENLRGGNSVVYYYSRYGAVRALRALFTDVPETKERYLAGLSFRVSADKLSEHTRELVHFAGNEYWKYLQYVGIVGGKPQSEPTGYGDGLKVSDEFDVALCRMDEVGGFTPGLRWGGTQLSTGYFHLLINGHDREMADLRAINQDWSQFLSRMNVRTLDRSTEDIDDGVNHYTKLMENLSKEEEILYPSEPLIEHEASVEMEKKLRLKLDRPDPKDNPAMPRAYYIARFQKALAEATGLGVVSDSWVSIPGEKLPEDKEKTLGELLDEFSSVFNYNWDKRAGILEFRDRKWWKNRLNQIPEEWVAAWSENTKKNGVLSLDDLSQISALTYDQVNESLFADKVLGVAGIYRTMLKTLDYNGVVHWLRLYAKLNPYMRALLVSEQGVNGQMLTTDQWRQAQVLFDRIGAMRGDAVFRMIDVSNKNRVKYRFQESDRDSGEVDRDWELEMPKYEPPKEKSE